MNLVKLGPSDECSSLGMGCWAIGGHGWGDVNDSDSMEALRMAYDMGVSLFDTADCYGLGHSERLLSRAFDKRLSDLFVCTKGGVRWNQSGKVWADTHPHYLENALNSSLKRLNIESIPLYYIHKPDGCTPIEESMYFLEKARKAGKIRAIGLSNFSAQEIERACSISSIDVAQLRLNLLDWEELESLEKVCKTQSISIVTWGCLADGLLTGKFDINSTFKENDHRFRDPNFQGDRFARNLEFVEQLSRLANDYGLSNGKVAMKFLLQETSTQCVLFGAKTSEQVSSNATIKEGLPSDFIQKIWFLIHEYKKYRMSNRRIES